MNARQICDCEEVGDAGARLCTTALPGVDLYLSRWKRSDRF
jgi:hypothetical protein